MYVVQFGKFLGRAKLMQVFALPVLSGLLSRNFCLKEQDKAKIKRFFKKFAEKNVLIRKGFFSLFMLYCKEVKIVSINFRSAL